MDKGQLYFFIGPARSGKSTIANKWVKYLIDIEPNGVIRPHCTQNGNYTRKILYGAKPRVIVCGDDIRLAITGKRFKQEAEPMVGAFKRAMIRSLLLSGHDVLVDGTHTTEESILKLLHEDPNAIPYFLNTPQHVCEERARESGQDDLIEYNVIHRMFNNVQQLFLDRCGGTYPATQDDGGVKIMYAIVEKMRKEVKES